MFRYLYIYILLTGIALPIVFFTKYRFEDRYEYLGLNFFFLAVSSLIIDFFTIQKLYPLYSKQLSKGMFTLCYIFLDITILFIAQPGVYYLTYTTFKLYNLPNVLPMVPFAVLLIFQSSVSTLVKKYQKTLGAYRDINEESGLAFVGYRFIDGLFLNSLILNLILIFSSIKLFG